MILQGELGSFIKIDHIKREFPDLDDYWDGNWLEANIKVEMSDFMFRCRSWFTVMEFQNLYDNLMKLSNLTVKEVDFTPLELGLILNFSINKRGIVTCSGTISDDLHKNSLDFTFETYLSFLDDFINQLKSILVQYPLVRKKE